MVQRFKKYLPEDVRKEAEREVASGKLDAVMVSQWADNYEGTLETLDMSKNVLGDDGAVAIARMLRKGNTSWQKIYLSESEIGEKGGKALGKALVGVPQLVELNLSGNKIGTMTCKAMAPSLQKMTNLKRLDLDDKVLLC